jgi:hypothetical protein
MLPEVKLPLEHLNVKPNEVAAQGTSPMQVILCGLICDSSLLGFAPGLDAYLSFSDCTILLAHRSPQS